jgi:hypothetical protein
MLEQNPRRTSSEDEPKYTEDDLLPMESTTFTGDSLATQEVSVADPDTIGPSDFEATKALAEARIQIAAVAEELATIQSQFGDGRLLGSDSASQSPDGAMPNESYQQLEKVVRHLQVDLECASERAEQLAAEKEELLHAQARTEADLRLAQKSLEEMHLRLQHTEMSRGREPPAFPSNTPKEFESESRGMSVPSPLQEAAKLSLASKPALALSKQQAAAMLRAAQVELREERKCRDRLERRIKKDKERLERLVAVAETQMKENMVLQKRCAQSEEHAQECSSHLQQALEHSRALEMELEGFRRDSWDMDIGGKRPTQPPLGSRGNSRGNSSSGSMSRQQSAPTRLPNVPNTLAASRT